MLAYFRPTSLDEALRVRAGQPVTVLAGGTDIYPARAARVGWGDMRDPDLLDISAIESLRGIAATATHIRLGALVTWSELRRTALPPAFDCCNEAARAVGGAQVQSRGTLAGNICTASPAGDGVPCLMALDAEIELASLAGRRTLSIGEFITGYRQNACRPDEIVTAILIPLTAARAQGRFLKLGARRYLVISIAMAAGVITAGEDGSIADARLAVGACGPVARRLPGLELALRGRTLAEAPDIAAPEHLADLAPIDDIRASATFRQSAALQLIRDLLAGFSDAARQRAA